MVCLCSGDSRKQVLERLVEARLKLLVRSQRHCVPPFWDVGRPLNEVNVWCQLASAQPLPTTPATINGFEFDRLSNLVYTVYTILVILRSPIQPSR